MKINNICLYGLLSVAMITSCKKGSLDKSPHDQTPNASFWKTENDARLAVNGCYNLMSGAALDSWYFDAFADNAYGQYPWESSATEVSAGNITSALDAGYDYSIIRRTNNFLDHVGQVPMDATLKKRYIAEVKFLRAFKYLYLAELFGDVPLLLTSEHTDADLKPVKQQEVIDFVTAELKAIAPDLPLSYAGGSGIEKGRITKGAALALLARTYLFHNKWTEAATVAKSIIDLNTYALFSIASLSAADIKDDYSSFITFTSDADKDNFYLGLRSYEQLFWFANSGNKEFILETQFLENSPDDRSSYINTFMLPSEGNGWSSITPTLEMVDSYWKRDGSKFVPPANAVRASNYNSGNPSPAYFDEFKNRDTRLYASIMFTNNPWEALASNYKYAWGIGGNNNSKTGYNFRKLVDPAYTLQANAPQSYPLIRYAEVLLTYAEAKNEASGPDNTVYDALDQIRDRVKMPRIERTQTQSSLRDIIRNERRIEMAAEGLRYFDIKRWDIASQVMKDEYNVLNTLVQARKWEDKFKLLPYPQVAVDRNKNLEAPQATKGY